MELEKNGLGFSNLAFCCWMALGDHTRRRKCRTNHITALGCERLHHQTYCPDLALSDFHLFPALKKNLAGRPFVSNAEFKLAAKRFFRMQSPEFFLGDFLKLIKRYDKCLNVLDTNVVK
ncbi:histone-lysine N-methyltransferase SETMAR [Trichonephila clavipes]|nr:histone-lysine N-methyltransferase SETMAR [Trichonephila clavipes]